MSRTRTLILIALAATGSAGAQTLPSGFRLVADVEDDRPARPAFGGWAWSTPQGLVLAGGDALWRVDPQGQEPPALLLRQVVPDHVQQLGGDLVAWGLGPDDERGLWLTDGAAVHRLAPASFSRIGPVARFGDDFLTKQWRYGAASTGELWRLSPGQEPVSAGVGGVYDTGFEPLCTGVWSVPTGFLMCGRFDGQLKLRLTDGYGSVDEVESVVLIGDQQAPLVVAGVTYLVSHEGPALVASGSTVGDTRVLATDLAGPPFELSGEIAWIGCDGWTCRIWAGGGAEPRVVRELPFYVESVSPRPIDGRLYFARHFAGSWELWVLEGEAFAKLGTLPGRPVAPMIGNGNPGEAVLLVHAPNYRLETWLVDSLSGSLARIAGGSWDYPPFGPVLSAAPPGQEPLVAWIDTAGSARAGRVTTDGAIAPFNGLDLAATASSRPFLMGARGDETWFWAWTGDGGAIWRSRGTAATTTPAFPSACLASFPKDRPQLLDNFLVDCVREDGWATAWFLGGDTPVAMELRIRPQPTSFIAPNPVRAAELGRGLVYAGYHEGQFLLLGQSPVDDGVVVLGPGGCEAMARTGDRVVTSCPSAAWSTDGTAAGSMALPVEPGLLSEVGGKVLVVGGSAWLTDGTPAGTQELSEHLIGAAPASPWSTWTCGWSYHGLFRLELPSGDLELLAQVPPIWWFPVPRSGDDVAVLVGGGTWWRCDGTVEGTRILTAEPFSRRTERLVATDDVLWRHSKGTRERVDRLSLTTGQWTTLADLPAAVEEFPVDEALDAMSPLVLSGDSLWLTLPDPQFGREPWILDVGPLFADGFESGDLRAWAQDTALSAEQLAR